MSTHSTVGDSLPAHLFMLTWSELLTLNCIISAQYAITFVFKPLNFVLSRLNYCNSLLAGLPKNLIEMLQRSLWYNRNGWLGVKHQVTYMLQRIQSNAASLLLQSSSFWPCFSSSWVLALASSFKTMWLQTLLSLFVFVFWMQAPCAYWGEAQINTTYSCCYCSCYYCSSCCCCFLCCSRYCCSTCPYYSYSGWFL